MIQVQTSHTVRAQPIQKGVLHKQGKRLHQYLLAEACMTAPFKSVSCFLSYLSTKSTLFLPYLILSNGLGLFNWRYSQ